MSAVSFGQRGAHQDLVPRGGNTHRALVPQRIGQKSRREGCAASNRGIANQITDRLPALRTADLLTLHLLNQLRFVQNRGIYADTKRTGGRRAG